MPKRWLTLEEVHAMARHRGLDPDKMPFPLYWYLDSAAANWRKKPELAPLHPRYKAGEIEEAMDKWQKQMADEVVAMLVAGDR